MIKLGGLFETRKDRNQFLKWVRALRSGEYSQGTGRLQSSKSGKYCCLGVGCKVLIPEKHLDYDSESMLVGEYPQAQGNFSPRWLNEINEDFSYKADYLLTELNDSSLRPDNETDYKHFTFDEIADVLEAVYILGVLDDEK